MQLLEGTHSRCGKSDIVMMSPDWRGGFGREGGGEAAVDEVEKCHDEVRDYGRLVRTGTGNVALHALRPYVRKSWGLGGLLLSGTQPCYPKLTSGSRDLIRLRLKASSVLLSTCFKARRLSRYCMLLSHNVNSKLTSGRTVHQGPMRHLTFTCELHRHW